LTRDVACIDALVFDLDGTLVDSASGILATMASVVAEAGLTAKVDLGPQLIGPPLKTTLARITGLDDDGLLEALGQAFKRRYDAEVALHTHPYPGIAEALAAFWQRGMPMHLATNKRSTPTQQILKAQGWDRYFKSVYTQDGITLGYPNKAAMLDALLQEQSLVHERALYIGDTREDGLSALANDMCFAAASWGYGGNPELWELPDPWHTLEQPVDLLDAPYLGRLT